jgi:hypothetical protein
MKIPRGKYIVKNADPHKPKAEHFFHVRNVRRMG